MENCTIGFSIFRKLHLGVFNFLTLFLYFMVRGNAQHSEPPALFYWKSSLVVGDCFLLEID